MGNAYRDENQAALAAISQLRDETARLRSEVADIERRLDAAEYRAGFWPGRPSGRNGGAVFAVVAGVLAIGVGALMLRPAPKSPASATPTAGRYFDRGVAENALRAVDVSDCASSGGPSGQGHVLVTFEPSGRANGALVDPPIGGTSAGMCVATKFSHVRIPPFVGGPTRVGQSFELAR